MPKIKENTQIKGMGASLAKETDFSETIINSLPGVFYLINEDGRFVKWNTNFEKVSGYSHEEMAKISPLDLFAGKDKENVSKKIKNVFTEGEDSVEANLKSKNGSFAPYYFTGKRININGKIFLSGMGIDIFHRKKAEEEAKASEEVFRMLFEFAPDTFYIIDMKGNFIDGNKAAEELTGYKREELIGKNISNLDLLSSDSLIKAVVSLAKNNLGIASEPDEYQLKRKDGKRIYVEIRDVPLELRGKKVALGVARDITERKAVEEALKQRNEELELFNKISTDRELKMIELKKKISELEKIINK